MGPDQIIFVFFSVGELDDSFFKHFFLFLKGHFFFFFKGNFYYVYIVPVALFHVD